jgi:glycosyltransferase involved in cell wall biosynthesis
MSTPRVSVLMTVYNGAAYLRESIDSVLAQTYRDFEFVIVDDGSSDESARIVRSYADPRIKLHVAPHNLGQTTALNVGLRLCVGEFVARMDGDDVCHPERFARQIAALDADPALGIVGSAVTIVDGRGRPLDFSPQLESDAAIRFVSLTRNPFHHPTVVMRRRTLLDHGLEYDERFQANQDFELWSRLLTATRAANLPQALLRYRVHGSNISVKRLAEQQRTSIEFCRKRQLDEGMAPLDAQTLFGIFDALHGSRIVGIERLADAGPAIDAFLTLAETRAADTDSRRWATSLAMRALVLRRVGRGRAALAARALRLSIRVPIDLVVANAPTLFFRSIRAFDAPPAEERSLMVVVASLRVGGTERHIGAILPELARAGWKIVVRRTGADGPIGDRLRASGIEVIDADISTDRLRWLPPLLRGLIAYLVHAVPMALDIRRRRPAIVHAFLPGPTIIAGFACAIARHRPFVASRRALNHYQATNPRAAWIERLVLARADAILGNSRAVMRDLAGEGHDPSRFALIYNGAPPAGEIVPRTVFRAREGWASGEIAMVIVANLLAYKGHLDLVEALAVLPPDLPHWTLNIVGRDDGEGAAVTARAAALGLREHVRLLGPRDDVGVILAASDIAVSASHEEGFSNSVIEAMAAGLPVVATAAGGSMDAVADGVTGRLVPVRAPEKLAAALAELIADQGKRARFGAAGAERARSHFSLDACVRNYMSLYGGLSLAPHARPSDLVPDTKFEAASR